MEKITLITSWSGKVMRARKQHVCENCGAVIKIGTWYQRDVVRMGEKKFVSSLRNIHQHLDCQTPWHHAGTVHILPYLGQIKLAPADVDDLEQVPMVASVSEDSVGSVTWQMPQTLARQIKKSSPKIQQACLNEINHTLSVIISALVTAAGNRRQSMRISHALNELIIVKNDT